MINHVYMLLCNHSQSLMLNFDCIQNGLTAYDFASSRSHAAVCQLLEQHGYKVASIIMVPLIIIITTGLSHSQVIDLVILCQPLSSQPAGNMILSQAYRLSGISWSMGLNCLIILNIKKVILLHNNIRMMNWTKLIRT